ncbi:hypothetical protein B7P43_G05399 [Cryptotermes secundus]|uniref:Endonuclease/exonuclease/phosphatase domain-containing protein n=1 Tax=Cryptotermes secundus TaxID=105785 RepID=A0A2J7Q7L8_9NEOP|nr:hypothetical protein B7P43_G05399 [Cryptotermes secundus]
MSLRAAVVRRWGHIIGNILTKNNVARRTSRGRRPQEKPEGSNGPKKRVQKTAAASWERGNSQPNPQEEPRTRDRESNSWTSYQPEDKNELDLMEGLTPSKTKKETAHMGGTGMANKTIFLYYGTTTPPIGSLGGGVFLEENVMQELRQEKVRRSEGISRLQDWNMELYYSGGERAERGVAIVVHKSVVRNVVKKIVCNDRIIALKLKAEPVDILIMQVYMPASEYEDDEVEKVYDTIEEILQEDGRGDTNSIILGDWNSSVGEESSEYCWITWTRKTESRVKYLLTFVKEMD